VVTDHWSKVLHDLITEHVTRTGSLLAKTILDNWQLELRSFVHVVPKESVARLAAPLELKAAE
jgi:glutamate synthase (NADPH/NADH) large chain